MNKHDLYVAVIKVADSQGLSNYHTEILCQCYKANVSERECAALMKTSVQLVKMLYMRIAMKLACVQLEKTSASTLALHS